MENNATILTRLEGLFDVMDPRANVDIYNQIKEDHQELLRANKLYNLLADNEFIGKYGSYKVIGLSITLGVTSILIEEA